MSEPVVYEKKNGVGHIILNSPPANAMSPELMAKLDEIAGEAGADPECRAVLIRSSVEKIFMAGADIKFMASLQEKEEEFRQYIKTAQEIYCRIEALPKPTIAVINGHALGGGCELTLCCDFRFMAEGKARIGLPEVNLGLLPGAGGTQRLAMIVGRSRATDMLLRGLTLTASEAQAIGLVHQALPPEKLLDEAVKFAEELAKGATQAIARIKACLRAAYDKPLSEGLQEELDGITYLFTRTKDSREGLTAFVEKRKPVYEGR